MRNGRSVSMELSMWTSVAAIAESEHDGDVSASVEALCSEALKARAMATDHTKIEEDEQ